MKPALRVTMLSALLLGIGYINPLLVIGSVAENQLTVIKAPALKERLCSSNINTNNIYRLYYEEGALYVAAQCLDGQARGYAKYYYDNGQLWMHSRYVHGKLDGPSTHYFADGGVWKEQAYKDEQQDGVQKEYNRSGNLVREENYLKGQVEGLSQRFDRDGNVEEKELYKNGRKITSETFAPANVSPSQRRTSLFAGDLEFSLDVMQKSSIPSQRRQVDMTGQNTARGRGCIDSNKTETDWSNIKIGYCQVNEAHPEQTQGCEKKSEF